MTKELAQEIQDAQNHGRQKHGKGPDDFAHDDSHSDEDWHDFIQDHLNRLHDGEMPMDRLNELVKIAGLCCSAIESFKRRNPRYDLRNSAP